MNSSWLKFYEAVIAYVCELENSGCDIPFFRGHYNAAWQLKPSLGRTNLTKEKIESAEGRIYYDFISLGGPLTKPLQSSWETLFAMQHHGLPTRLLDWTTSFSTALYFAVNPQFQNTNPACVWVLNPFQLNKIFCSSAVVLTPPDDFEEGYYENFITQEKTLGHKVVAINPLRLNPRQLAQDSTFTLFADLEHPLEDIAPKTVKKFDIPSNAFNDALKFLQMSGANEYKIFPDLDGIARYIKSKHWDFT